MQTSHRDEYTDVYAGFFVRFVAFILDLIVIGIGSLVVKGMFSFNFLDSNFMSNNVLFHYSIMDICLYFLKAAYFILCIYASGTTLGKYVLKLKVVDKDGRKLTFLNVLYRETVGRFLSSIFFIGYIMIIIDKEKRSLHDRLCDTRVIYSCKVIRNVEIHQNGGISIPQTNIEPVQQESMEENTKEASDGTERI